MTLSEFFHNQMATWPETAARYADLGTRGGERLRCGQCPVQPRTHGEHGAKVDKKTLAQRPCFLCKDHRPEIQQEWAFDEDFDVLVNPFPILPTHFTIAVRRHRPQTILDTYATLYELADRFEARLFFYNGPKCGPVRPTISTSGGDGSVVLALPRLARMEGAATGGGAAGRRQPPLHHRGLPLPHPLVLISNDKTLSADAFPPGLCRPALPSRRHRADAQRAGMARGGQRRHHSAASGEAPPRLLHGLVRSRPHAHLAGCARHGRTGHHAAQGGLRPTDALPAGEDGRRGGAWAGGLRQGVAPSAGTEGRRRHHERDGGGLCPGGLLHGRRHATDGTADREGKGRKDPVAGKNHTTRSRSLPIPRSLRSRCPRSRSASDSTGSARRRRPSRGCCGWRPTAIGCGSSTNCPWNAISPVSSPARCGPPRRHRSCGPMPSSPAVGS